MQRHYSLTEQDKIKLVRVKLNNDPDLLEYFESLLKKVDVNRNESIASDITS